MNRSAVESHVEDHYSEESSIQLSSVQDAEPLERTG